MDQTHAKRVMTHQQTIAFKAALRDMSDLNIVRLLDAGDLLSPSARDAALEEARRRGIK